MSERQTLRDRFTTALRVLRGAGAATRSVMPMSYPNIPPGTASMQLVRTANPQEYKPDGAAIRLKGFSAHPVVHACIRVVTDIVASVPLVVLKTQGDTESRVDPSHPLQVLLDRPNPRLTARQLRARLSVDYMGYGNALTQIERTGINGKPIGLRPINPESLQSVWVDAEGDPRRYDYGNWAGIIVQAPVEDILHVRDLDMPRPFAPDVFGFPRGATAIASMLADNEATNYVRQVVTNDGTPTFAVLLADEATQDDATAMQDRYRARVVDRGKRGTPAFFGAVKDIKPLGFTLSDLEFPDLRRVSREDICAAFGVDPRMVGIASASNDGGLSGVQYAEARARLVQHTIEPMMSAIVDELNHWLAPEFGDVFIAFDSDVLRDLVENDAETSKRVQDEFKASLRTWEESRRALKLPAVPEPTDTLLQTMGAQLIPAAVAVMASPDTVPADPSVTAATGIVAPMGTGDIQSTALNGAQTSALIEMLAQVVNGTLPLATVDALIQAAFPGVPSELITAMLTGLKGFTPAAQPTAAAVLPARSVAREARVMVRTWAEDALSGDQIEQLAELLESVIEQELPAAAVQAIIAAAFPKMDPALITSMLDALVGFVPAPEAPESPEDGGEDSEPNMYADASGAARMDAADSLANDPRDAYWQRAMSDLDSVEGDFYAAAQRCFRDDAADIAAMFADAERSDPILKRINDRIRAAYGKKGEYYKRWKDAYTGLIGKTYMGGARQVGGVGLSFSLQSPEVIKAVQDRAERLAGFIGEETSKQVTAAIHAAEVGGMSVADTAALIQASVYGESMTDVRATRIAKTEAAGAMSQGSWDQANDMEIYQAKEWLAFEDAKTRETHLYCMGEGPIPIAEVFAANGLLYPLDPAGPAGEVINCRCVLKYYDQPASEVQRI